MGLVGEPPADNAPTGLRNLRDVGGIPAAGGRRVAHGRLYRSDAPIVGDPDHVLAKLNAYRELGIEAFILSGYPHAAEADLFARHVLPRLEHGPLDAA